MRTKNAGAGGIGIRNKGKRLNAYVKDYVVFDLETTGIHQERDSIIEISAIKVQDGIIKAEYSTLVNPGRHIPAGATAVNGITDAMVAGAPDIADAIGGFMDFIESDILVGHNIHTFDTNFAYDAAWRALGKAMNNDYIDTLYMARRCLPQLAHHRLTDVSEYFHIETKGAHRALNDCVMNQKCYEEMGKLLLTSGKLYGGETADCQGIDNGSKNRNKSRKAAEGAKETEENQEFPKCPECGGILCKRKGKFGVFYGCGNFPVCRFTRNV